MAAPKRGSTRRASDLPEIARLYLTGVNQCELARRFGVSQSQISQDIAAVESEWKRVAVANIAAAKARELAKLDEIERVAWVEWERSRTGFKSVTKKRVGKRGKVETTTRTENRCGDPRYLKTITDCVIERCKIRGIIKPEPEGTSEGNTVIIYNAAPRPGDDVGKKEVENH